MLNTQAHMAAYDDFYEALLQAHQGLSTDESHALNARLVLLLANHIGDMVVLRQALQAAGGRPAGESVDAAQAVPRNPAAPAHAPR